MKHRVRGRRPGVTLAELLVVITIITISVTLILPVVINLARTRRVKSGAREIQAKLHGARAFAIAQRAPFALRLYEVPPEEADAPQARFACLIIDQADTAAVREEVELLPMGLRVLVYHSGDTTPRPMPQRIWFRPDGTVDPVLTTPVRIFLVNADDSTETTDITVRRTGAIEVSD